MFTNSFWNSLFGFGNITELNFAEPVVFIENGRESEI
tara:strand:+ start:45 stop:155 length:111 start_codon:yes stop_codon:yes gene_type:complete